MVEVNHTSEGLARISIVNYNGHILMDNFVRPKGEITNYRSWVSGVYPDSMKGKQFNFIQCIIISYLEALDYDTARKKAIEILTNRVIIGHSLKHDFKVLNWEPLDHNVRDLITFKKFQNDKHPVSLK